MTNTATTARDPKAPFDSTPPPIIIVEPVGIAEIAEALGVTRDTVNSWRHRSKKGDRKTAPLPEPDIIISGTPIWSWAVIHTWAVATGRLT